MERLTKLSILIGLIISTLSFVATAQNTPRWVTKGTKSINAQRSNDSYTVVSFNTWGFQLEELEEKGAEVLKKYVEENFGAEGPSVKIITLSNGAQPVYEITYSNAENPENSIIAKRIDTYSKFDDYELNVYQFEYYQLYAITRPNVAPLFDTFSYTKTYAGATTVMSLVPGMAQLYKSQDTKGYVIIGSEIAFAGAALIFDYKRRDCAEWGSRDDQQPYADSWHSKERTWKNFEIGAIACFAGVYIYNIIDGLTSKGAPQVIVRKMHNPYASVSPFLTPDHTGISFTLNF